MVIITKKSIELLFCAKLVGICVKFAKILEVGVICCVLLSVMMRWSIKMLHLICFKVIFLQDPFFVVRFKCLEVVKHCCPI